MVATQGLVIYSRGMVDDTKQIKKSCNVHRLYHRGMVDDTKQIRKSCNLRRLFHRGMVDNGEFSIFL